MKPGLAVYLGDGLGGDWLVWARTDGILDRTVEVLR